MLRSTFRVFIFLGGALGLASVCPAQGSKGLDVAGSAPVMLNSPTVQKELQLTADQIAKGKQLAEDYQAEATRGALSLLGNPLDLVKLTPAEREAKLLETKKKAEKLGEDLSEKYKPKAAAILNPEQLKRLQQIGWQFVGPLALSDPALADNLTLTEEQDTKLAALLKTFMEKQAAAMTSSATGDANAAATKLQEAIKERDAAVAALLTPEQSTKYASLLGKPVNIQAISQEIQGSGAAAAPRSNTPAPKPPAKTQPAPAKTQPAPTKTKK